MKIALAMVVATLCAITFYPRNAYAEQKLHWNGKFINGWVCDGVVLKPQFGANSSNTWIYKNGEIRPKFGANSSNTWIFKNGELRPKFGANSSNTWVLKGDKIKPKFGANSTNTWRVGDAPILVIAGAVVLRLF